MGPSFVDSLPVSKTALALARERHAHQHRAGDGAPFVLHPLEVGHLLHISGAPDHVVAAGILHDVLERTETDTWDIDARCGREVTDLVEAVTDDRGIRDREERKAALRRKVRDSHPHAVLVFAADKVSKVRELRLRLAVGQMDDATEKLEHYRASLALAEETVPSHPLTQQLRFELEALEALPPGETGSRTTLAA